MQVRTGPGTGAEAGETDVRATEANPTPRRCHSPNRPSAALMPGGGEMGSVRVTRTDPGPPPRATQAERR